MHRVRSSAVVSAAMLVLALAACADDGDVDGPGASEHASADLPLDGPGVEVPEIVDGAVRGQGVIMPIPEGWEVDPQAYTQGLVVTGPPDAPGEEAILAAAGLESNPYLGFQGLSYDDVLEVLRAIDPDAELSVDTDVEFAGAARAHMLLFEGVTGGQPDLPATDQFIVLAVDDDGRVALFNYSGPAGEYDASIGDMLLESAGLDPDSEPVVPQVPEQPLP